MRKYSIAEIFYSIQGEGARVGTPAVFVRFAGCNLKCTKEATGFNCDTDHGERFVLTGQEIVDRAIDVGGTCRYVVFTGGEPARQMSDALVDLFKARHFTIAIETNGTLPIPLGVDWITVSPKPGHLVRQHLANEVRVVLHDGQDLPDLSGFLTRRVYLSPAFDGDRVDEEALKHCVQLCLTHPELRLSVQAHKLWGIR